MNANKLHTGTANKKIDNKKRPKLPDEERRIRKVESNNRWKAKTRQST